ncbi:MAG: NAD-dependent epimerase/dehydratase family protein [Candidatus Altiarchaeales archaeon]|nr:NAD-dependent epimerase/dehydratase family protein [Candidatus Altiarchaeales archaeon]MBD3415650.1 NAD-dependent epimerase/dehydratase family protein [Candidatus Altiarchaeales archaeon]
MGEKVFITGATGFVGANLAAALVEEGYEVHALLREGSDDWRLQPIVSSLKVRKGDVTRYEHLERTLSEIRPDYILHLAAYGAYPDVQTSMERIVETNYLGTVNLVRASAGIKYKMLINTGSSSEYGLKEGPMEEEDIPSPVNYYGAAKAAATIMCQTYSRLEDKPIVTLRPFSVYGPWEEPIRLIPQVISHCLRGEDMSLTEGSQVRDFIYVDDVVAAYMKAMERPDLAGEIINVGSGIQHSIRETAETIHGLMDSRIKLNFGVRGKRENEPLSWVANTSKAEELLGHKTAYDLEAGLSETIDWIGKHPERYR